MEPKKRDYTMFAAFVIVTVPCVILVMAVLSYGACKDCTLYVYMQNLNTALERLEAVNYGLTNPHIYFELANEYTGKFIFTGFMVLGFVLIYIIAGRRNYIKGREYGTDKYANVNAVNRRLRDPDKKNIFQYKYERYTLLEKAAANLNCYKIKIKKRQERRKKGIE
ncbi:MAG: hypothetical protein NC242_12875 [Roseburia sp.]|nr:hypothetical protein [Roseburia sp.]